MPVNNLTSDAVIIGAGIGGLTAAALLAKAGRKVIIAEEQPVCGGYLADFTRKGFIFDSSVQWLNQCSPGGLVYKIMNYIDPGFPECERMQNIRRYRGKDFDYLLTGCPDRLRDKLINDFPAEKKNLLKFFSDCKKIGGHFMLLNRRQRLPETMSLIEKTLFGLKMLIWLVPVWKYLKMGMETGLSKYFKNERLKKIFISEDSFLSLVVPIAWAYSGDYQRLPRGGAAVFINRLCTKIQSGGGIILTSSRADKIIIEKRKACGILLADGRRISAPLVICACDQLALYEKLIAPGIISGKFIKKMQKTELFYSGFSVYLGLDINLSSLGFKDELITIFPPDNTNADCKSRDPGRVPIAVKTSAADNNFSPAGKSTMVIHATAFMDYENSWKTGAGYERGKDYRDLKKRWADELIDRTEKALDINLRDHIEVMETASPVTFYRYTRNRAGTIMGQTPAAVNIKNRAAHYRTPVKNLLICGHWAEYSGGVPIAVKSGANTALLALAQANKTEFKKLARIMDT